MKIITIVGARPQFVKASVISKKIRSKHREILIHTGQHYDNNMSEIFFCEMEIPRPDYNLHIGSGTHGKQTGEMLIQIEQILLSEKPEGVIVYGDTNSTLAGALAASKLHIPIFHIEAGLRSFNMTMPEEQNRRITDHISNLLFCPTNTAVCNLKNEGIVDGVFNVGDIMLDAVLHFSILAEQKQYMLDNLAIFPQEYYLATIHRAENTDTIDKLGEIVGAFLELDKPVIMPVHPRSRIMIASIVNTMKVNNQVKFIEPVGYLEMLMLTNNACKIITDSGGLQKEAFFLQVPCITIRKETEWIETLNGNCNVLCNVNKQDIVDAVFRTVIKKDAFSQMYFGDGKAAMKICDFIN